MTGRVKATSAYDGIVRLAPPFPASTSNRIFGTHRCSAQAVEHLRDLTPDLKRISGLDAPFPLVRGRGDEAKHCGGSDSRDGQALSPKPRDIYVADVYIDTLKLKARNFR